MIFGMGSPFLTLHTCKTPTAPEHIHTAHLRKIDADGAHTEPLHMYIKAVGLRYPCCMDMVLANCEWLMGSLCLSWWTMKRFEGLSLRGGYSPRLRSHAPLPELPMVDEWVVRGPPAQPVFLPRGPENEDILVPFPTAFEFLVGR